MEETHSEHSVATHALTKAIKHAQELFLDAQLPTGSVEHTRTMPNGLFEALDLSWNRKTFCVGTRHLMECNLATRVELARVIPKLYQYLVKARCANLDEMVDSTNTLNEFCQNLEAPVFAP